MPDAMVAARASEATSSGKAQTVDVAVVGPDLPACTFCIGCAKPVSRPCAGRGRRRRRHLVLEPISRRALRHPDHRLQLHFRSGTGAARGSGRRNTRRSPRSCATSASSPTATTCGATSASAPGSRRRPGIRPRSAGCSRPTPARPYPAAITSWPPAVSPRPSRRRSMVSRTSRARSISPAAGRTRGQSRRQTRRGHRHGIVGDPVDPADRRAGSRTHRLPAHAELRLARPQRSGAGAIALPCWKATAPPIASRPAGRSPACRWPQQTMSAGSSAMPSAASASRRRGPAAISSTC